MGKVVAFSEFDAYYSKLPKSDAPVGTILDTNILISLSYEIESNHEEVVDFFERIDRYGIQYYATVSTKSEFLDFHRRLLITENLRTLASADSKFKIAAAARAQIQVQSGQLTRREQEGGDAIFTDTQIKKIKSVFSAARHSSQAGWLLICESFLRGRLVDVEQVLQARGIEYISQHDLAQTELFHRKIDWPDARSISEVTCLGLSDSMILNALQCSVCPFIISTDFDIGYATLSSPPMKDVVMPDSLAKKYRSYHFDSIET